MSACVEGTPIEFSAESIGQMTDLAKVKKIYKLTDGGGNFGKDGKGLGAEGKMDGEEKRTNLEIMVMGIMALRGQT